MDLDVIRAAACDLTRKGRLREAETLLRHVLLEAPGDTESATDLAMTLLAQGRWEEGARLYEARLARMRDPELPFPRWSGEPLDGKRVLIWPEQGLGDQIMCARFALALRERGCDVSLVCAPTLERLFARSLPVRVLPAKGSIELPDVDVWLWTMSLLAAVGSAKDPPYLSASPRPAPFRIGIASRGSPTNGNDAHRSLPADVAAQLLSLPGSGSLLPEHTGASDMMETAEIISGLDLVISVDTSIAHLAGALGKTCWILLPDYATDWRWMRDREDSPWYPSARLFRQETPGDWAGVIARVKRRLGQRPDVFEAALQDAQE